MYMRRCAQCCVIRFKQVTACEASLFFVPLARGSRHCNQTLHSYVDDSRVASWIAAVLHSSPLFEFCVHTAQVVLRPETISQCTHAYHFCLFAVLMDVHGFMHACQQALIHLPTSACVLVPTPCLYMIQYVFNNMQQMGGWPNSFKFIFAIGPAACGACVL